MSEIGWEIEFKPVPNMLRVGRLGAMLLELPDGTFDLNNAGTVRIDMIERRILRIEVALANAGIDVTELPLP